ncbi:hypothetical protein SteCoe_20189 [Stentor coeruleus]|uniref:Protein kinase domain-containing protein n=1 Tax=Stentor coeruleus TaxID=5963 RepID=A0A1R2BSC3_9CILI|nr:hypothetical protein SteCoe_20189 [Stentor coeruleus]
MSLEKCENLLSKTLELFIPHIDINSSKIFSDLKQANLDKSILTTSFTGANETILDNIIEDYNKIIKYETNNRPSIYTQEQKIQLFFKYLQYLYGNDLDIHIYLALIKILSSETHVDISKIIIGKIKKIILQDMRIFELEDHKEAFDLIRKNLIILDNIKEYYPKEEIEAKKKMFGLQYEKSFAKVIKNPNGPSLKKIFTFYYKEYKEIIGVPFQMINYELKKRINYYFESNSDDLIKCERFLLKIVPDDFVHKEKLKKELLHMFTRHYTGMIIQKQENLDNKWTKYINTPQSTNYKITVLSEKIPEIIINFNYKSNTFLIEQLINDLNVFLTLNKYNTKIIFLGIWMNWENGINLWYSFEDFGDPIYEYCEKLKQNCVVLNDGKIFYLLKQMGLKAQELLNMGLFIDFLHPGNVFIKDGEIIVFPNTYAVMPFIETSKVNTIMFKQENCLKIDYFVEKSENYYMIDEVDIGSDKNKKLRDIDKVIDELNRSIAYSIGVMALYFRYPSLDFMQFIEYSDEIIARFEYPYCEILKKIIGRGEERISLDEFISQLE